MKNMLPIESLFNTPKAENEPWLSEVFIPVPAFERLKENHSTILYGEPGDGKTALRLELQNQKGAGIFTVLWMPEPILEPSATGTALAYQAIRQALQACVESLILEGDLPQRLREPASYIAAAIQWFIRNYLPYEPTFYLQSQTNKLTQDEIRWYLNLVEQSFPAIITEKTGIRDQIRLLITILRQAKYEQLWLTIDGLERWTGLQAGEQITVTLDAILSTLILFDAPEISYKFFVPISLRGILHKTTGVERHRAEEVLLKWSVENLRAMLDKRTALVLSPRKVSIDSLCQGTQFLRWLQEFGGYSPREWLRYAAPLITEYQKLGKTLTDVQIREFIRKNPAPIRLQHERREVWLGKKCIPISSATEFRLLEYLSIHSGKICSIEEVYYYAQENLGSVPDKADNVWVTKDILRGRIETIIWRVRKRIEPDPKRPLYLVTYHGKGLELLHTEA
jgi:hypothetical protein